MKYSSVIAAIVSVAALISGAGSARAELMVGDKAAALQTGQWVQGEPVAGFDRDHVYIVEFWATWCGPCIASIPHLNQVWQKYKDKGVICIGVDIWDGDDGVAPFVKKMGTNMTYRVALDDKRDNPNGFMGTTWWKRKVNHHGIPSAFIINRDGNIAWIGHPMTLKEDVLDQIVAGTYDLAKAAQDYKKEFEIDDQFDNLQTKLSGAIKQKKWDDAGAALGQINVLLPWTTNSFADTRLKILLGQRKFDEAWQVANAVSLRYATNGNWQNVIAWAIASDENQDAHCLALAESVAQRAVQLTHETNTDCLDTLARVQFMLGKKSDAIATEQKASGLEQDSRKKGGFEKVLASYQAGKLPAPDY